MRAVAVIGLVTGFGLLVQTTLFHALPFGFHPSPDILVIVCVFLGLHRHSVGGALGAFVLGYLQDAASGNPVGLNAFGMVVVFVLVYLTCRSLWVDNAVSKVVLVFLASCVKAVAVLAVSSLFGTFSGEWGPALSSMLINSAIAAAIAPPVFALLGAARLPEERDAL
jgi:rod shape-determining protein MreD